MIINCYKCGEPIPEGRLKAIPTTKVCVECSGVSKKRSVTITGGEGEDTYNDIVIMSQKEYEEYFGPEGGSTSLPDWEDSSDEA
jgi:RNA polymerase-binding transcription factor DksA